MVLMLRRLCNWKRESTYREFIYKRYEKTRRVVSL